MPSEVPLPAEHEECERQPDDGDLQVCGRRTRPPSVDAQQLDDGLAASAVRRRRRLCRSRARARSPARRDGQRVSRAPAPAARVTCDVVPYAEEVEDRERPAEHEPGDPERCELRPPEMADDRGVDEDEGRLGGERAEGQDGEAEDLAVVRREAR